MEDLEITFDASDDAIYKEVIDAHMTVTVVARPADDGLWELSIHGRGPQVTVWTDRYDSAQAAMDTGLAAILDEGVAAFYSCAEFENDSV